MEKIIEVNEENINFNENNDNNTNEAKTVTNEQNDTTNSLSNTKNENQKDINENKNQDLQNKKNDSKDIDIINKKKFSKKLKINKIKSRSGINLSRTPQDIQVQKLKKQKNEICLTKEPLFIQIIKSSESKLMNLYNYSFNESKKLKDQMETNFEILFNMTQDINKKHKKEIIILIREKENDNKNLSFLNILSIYSIGDCYYCLRKDYNFSLQIQYWFQFFDCLHLFFY